MDIEREGKEIEREGKEIERDKKKIDREGEKKDEVRRIRKIEREINETIDVYGYRARIRC